MNILVADDEPVIREIISRRLGHLGHTVHPAENAKIAGAALESHPEIELVITDIRMPDGSGVELLRLAKERNPHVEVILMTGYAEVDTAVSAVDAGAFAYLRKPFCVEELITAVARASEHIAMRREREEHEQRLKELVKKMAASERRYRTLVEGIRAAVLSADAHLVIRSASDRCREILGRPPEALIGTSADALRSPEDAQAFRGQVEALLRSGGGILQLDGRLLRPDGSVLYSVEIVTPFRENDLPDGACGIVWIVEDGTAAQRLRREAARAREYLEAVRRSRSADRRIVGDSRAIREVLRMVQSIAPSNASVLICGESGTGKELVAESIHVNSPRAADPFVVVNCATLQENLLESELFGHRRGAFTGAVADKTGLVEIANGGTLFVDEVGEMSPAIQGKLLRVLERGEFRSLGCTLDRTTDIRVIAATNRDLSKEVKAGRFREDLLYRLDVIRIEVPPLRGRKEDIPLIADHLLRHSRVTAREPKRLAPDALDALMAYDWPGNIRELSNVIERSVILSGPSQVIGTEHLLLVPGRLPAAVRTLKELQDAEMEKALALTGGNKSRAARMLGITRQTLLSRLKRRADEEGAAQPGLDG